MKQQRRKRRPATPQRSRQTKSEPQQAARQAPPIPSPSRAFPLEWRNEVFALLAVVAILWLARYWQIGGFGLYEDDHWRITATLHSTTGELLDRMGRILKRDVFGRVGHDFLIFSLAPMGWRLGALPGMHLLGFSILALNAALFFLLLRQVDLHPAAALSGSLALCLFPVDVSQVILTHSLGAQPALTLLLLAAFTHLAGGGWRVASYFIASLTLFVYESFYLLFIGVPWLDGGKRGRRLLRAWLWHAAISSAIFAAIAVLRLAYGDRRTSQASQMADLAGRVGFNLVHGPWVCMKLFFERPLEAAGDLPARWPFFLAALLLACGAFIVLARIIPWGRERAIDIEHPPGSASTGLSYFRLGLAGAGFLLLAYPLVFELPVYLAEGRTSRVHMAAVFGMALLFAAVSRALIRMAAKARFFFGSTLVLGGFISLLVLAGFRVQDEYVEKWRYQQAFMTDIVQQTPDLREGALVLVEAAKLKRDSGLNPWSWEIYHLLPAMFEFPHEWKTVPRIFWLEDGWREKVRASGDLFDGVSLVVIKRQTLEQHRLGDVFFFDAANGRLHRMSEPLLAGPHRFQLKPAPGKLTAAPFPPGPLYRRMAGRADVGSVRYTLSDPRQ